MGKTVRVWNPRKQKMEYVELNDSFYVRLPIKGTEGRRAFCWKHGYYYGKSYPVGGCPKCEKRRNLMAKRR